MYKLLVIDKNTWNYTIMYKLFVLGIIDIIQLKTNDYKQFFKKLQLYIKNIIMIKIKHLQMNKILALKKLIRTWHWINQIKPEKGSSKKHMKLISLM